MSQPIPMHPERGANPRCVRWIVPPQVVPFIGKVRRAPQPLAHLVAAGLLTHVELQSGCVITEIAQAHRWRSEGEQIRAALAEALLNPQEWQAESDINSDDQLAAVVNTVLAGQAGDYIRSHGGTVTLERAEADTVVLRLGGSCASCPALEFTLHRRLETEIRRRYQQLQSVHVSRIRQRRGLFRRSNVAPEPHRNPAAQ